MKKILLLPGHNGMMGSGTGDNGAVHPTLSKLWSQEDGLGSEFEIVKHVVTEVYKRCTDIPNTRVVLSHRGLEKGSYGMLPGEINQINPDIIIEVHLNSVGNDTVDGSEVLYWNTSKTGKNIASIIQKHLVLELKLNDRGLKAIKLEDRGANLLRKTKAPAVIVEGFFISALKSKEDRDSKINSYIKALVDAVHELA